MNQLKHIIIGLGMFVCAAVMPQTVSATSVAGGELIYQHIADSSYRFIFKLYSDCSGSAVPDSLPLCMTNTCTSNTLSYKMGKLGASTNLSTGCPNYKTVCDSPASTLPGYKEQFYSIIVTMPYRCSTWRIFTYLPNRNNSYNIQNPTSSSFYAEVTFNNAISHNNSSPFYATKPIVYAPLNLPYTLNIGVNDADGDSLWTDIVYPQTGVTVCTDTVSNVTMSSTNPPLNFRTNPIQTNNSFNWSNYSGHMTFTSTLSGKGTIALRTREYRNGVLIGSMLREMQITTMYVYTPPPVLDTIIVGPNPPQGPGYIYGCINKPLTLGFNIKSNDSDSKYFISDNSSVAIPGLNMTYLNQGTDSVRATLNWTPGVNDAGGHSMLILIADSSCKPPGIVLQYARTLDFKIWGPTQTSQDVGICLGKHAFLSVSGGGNYLWSVLPGGTQNSLSNPWIANPVATPTTTTSYVVTSNANLYCPNLNKDTVTVTVLPPSPGTAAVTNSFGCGFTNPGINYVYMCAGDTLSFCLNSSSSHQTAKLYQSSNANTVMQGSTVSYSNQGSKSADASFVWQSPANAGGFYPLVISTSDSACVPTGVANKKQQYVYVYVWPSTKTDLDSFLCPGDSMSLSASGGSSYSWSVLPGGTPNSLSNPYSRNPIVKPMVTTTYVVTSANNSGCTNNKDSVTIKVPVFISTPTAAKIIVAPDSIVSKFTVVTFTETSSGCTSPQYKWLVDGVPVGANLNTYSTSTLTNEQKVWCVVTCRDSCATPLNSISNKITAYVGLSVHYIDGSDKISLYPNPNNGDFTLLMDEQIAAGQSASVEITNMYGQVVYKKEITSTKEQISISNSAPGMYLLKAKYKGKTSILKFSIQ